MLARLNKMSFFLLHFQVAEFNEAAVSKLAHSFKDLKECLVENLSLHAYKSVVCRLKIENLVFRVVERGAEDPEAVRRSINVLFSFQRKLITDTTFLEDVRQW